MTPNGKAGPGDKGAQLPALGCWPGTATLVLAIITPWELPPDRDRCWGEAAAEGRPGSRPQAESSSGRGLGRVWEPEGRELFPGRVEAALGKSA